MVTKELGNSRICLFCASDFHLEMILLPYIKEKINTSKFIILTQTNLEPTLKKLLDRVNIDEKSKEKIWNLDWTEKDIHIVDKIKTNGKDINIVINGDYDYIKMANNYMKKDVNKQFSIIDCFHVGDINVDIDKLKIDYDCILNTKKL